VCDLETSRMGAPYIYDISHLRVKLATAAPTNLSFKGSDVWFIESCMIPRCW